VNDYTDSNNIQQPLLIKNNYYTYSNPTSLNPHQTSKIEISTTNRIKLERFYPQSGKEVSKLNKNSNLNSHAHISKFDNYKPNQTSTNNWFPPSNVPLTTNPLNYNGYKNNKVELPINNNGLLMNKTNIKNTINSKNNNDGDNQNNNENDSNNIKNNNYSYNNNNNNKNNNNERFYSPPNYNKKREIFMKNPDNFSEDNYNLEINESLNKPNTININVTHKLTTKRDSENEIFIKPNVYSQQNSPYLMTENNRKSKDVIKSKDFGIEPKEGRELNKNSKTAIQSFKEFSNSFKGFLFGEKKTVRNKCKCDSSLSDDNISCSRALQWIQYNYKLTDLESLKKDYEEMENAQADESNVNQIEKDLLRTFPSYPYFAKESEGLIEKININSLKCCFLLSLESIA